MIVTDSSVPNVDDSKTNETDVEDTDTEQSQTPKSASAKKLKKKKKKKTLLVAANELGKLKKTTPYTRFECPLYSAKLNVAQLKKAKDEKRLIRDLGLQL